jgi:hypothetical protein
MKRPIALAASVVAAFGLFWVSNPPAKAGGECTMTAGTTPTAAQQQACMNCMRINFPNGYQACGYTVVTDPNQYENPPATPQCTDDNHLWDQYLGKCVPKKDVKPCYDQNGLQTGNVPCKDN